MVTKYLVCLDRNLQIPSTKSQTISKFKWTKEKLFEFKILYLEFVCNLLFVFWNLKKLRLRSIGSVCAGTNSRSTGFFHVSKAKPSCVQKRCGRIGTSSKLGGQF